MSKPSKIRAALYARVSTAEQKTRNQLPPLREYIKRRGWKKTHEFIDRASGATDKRLLARLRRSSTALPRASSDSVAGSGIISIGSTG